MKAYLVRADFGYWGI